MGQNSASTNSSISLSTAAYASRFLGKKYNKENNHARQGSFGECTK